LEAARSTGAPAASPEGTAGSAAGPTALAQLPERVVDRVATMLRDGHPTLLSMSCISISSNLGRMLDVVKLDVEIYHHTP
jgi:hypothetical protein